MRASLRFCRIYDKLNTFVCLFLILLAPSVPQPAARNTSSFFFAYQTFFYHRRCCRRYCRVIFFFCFFLSLCFVFLSMYFPAFFFSTRARERGSIDENEKNPLPPAKSKLFEIKKVYSIFVFLLPSAFFFL